MSTPTNDRELLARRRTAHHAALGSLIGADAAAGLKLWRKLRRIETRLYALCVHYSNGTGGIDTAAWENAKDTAKRELIALFGEPLPAGLFINGDPRGHMLKLDCGSAGSPGVTIPPGMERDWGGNGILAAEIEEERP